MRKKNHFVAIVLVLVLAFLCGCGVNVTTQAVIDAIDAIGTVSLNSEKDITEAEQMYAILAENEKTKVSNRLELVDARSKYETLVAEEAEKTQKDAAEAAEREQAEKEALLKEATDAEATRALAYDFDFINAQNKNQNYYDYYLSNGWLYGRIYRSNSMRFAKERITGDKDKTLLSSKNAHTIFESEGYLYFLQWDEEANHYNICKMKTSGGDVTYLGKSNSSLQMINDSLYFETPKEEGGYLCKMDINGENKETIIKKEVYYPYVFDNWILYQDDNDNESLHKCDPDGSNDVKLNNRRSYCPIYDGEYIYFYTNENDIRYLMKIRPDGTGEERVADYQISDVGILLRDDYIYFCWVEDNGRLYRMKKDGTGLQLVTQDCYIGCMQFLENGQLIYWRLSSDYQYWEEIYICNADGSNKVVLAKD